MKRLTPDTIAARTLLVLIVGLMVSHVLSVALHLSDRTTALRYTGGEHIGEQIATIGRLIENTPYAERPTVAARADHARLHVAWSLDSTIEDQQDSTWQADVLRDALVAHLSRVGGPKFRLRDTYDGIGSVWKTHLQEDHSDFASGEVLFVSLQLSDGSWLNFATLVEPPETLWSLRFTLSMIVMLAAVAALSILVVRHQTRPLRTFAQAAHRLGTDVNAPPIPEHGPAEVKQAIQSFNQMQDRIRRFVEDRVQMLAAISHDLGTPITRLRLRAELIEDGDERNKVLADLEDMENMVSTSLSFARDEATSEPHVMVDLRSILQRVCNDISDAGHDVTLETGEEAVPYGCRPVALRRAFTNLIENAVKYGCQARVSLAGDETGILVTIDDNGPGIPCDLHEEAFRPFRRLESSRSRETGGTGLGLTVARTIIHAHGGEVTLTNRDEGGLRVSVELPN